MLENEPVAMWGIAGPALSDHAFVWAAFGKEMLRHPFAIVKRARDELEEMQFRGGDLYAAIGSNDLRALTLAQALGFQYTRDVDAGDGFTGMVFRGQRKANSSPKGPPFIIHGLGRSRTAWLAEFLSYGGWTCHHEQSVYMREVADIATFFRRPRTGTAETSASFGWALIKAACPDIKQVVIVRDATEASNAMAEQYRKHDLEFDGEKLKSVFARGEKVLQKISAQHGTLTLSYSDLDAEEGCKRIFEFCLPVPFDREWWLAMKDRYVEVDLPPLVAYYQANREGIEGFKKKCKRELIRSARAGELSHAVN